MRKKEHIKLTIAFLLIAHFLFAQNFSISPTLRIKKIPVQAILVFDSLPVVEHSLVIESTLPSQYEINFNKAQIVWLQMPKTDSVLIKYRIIPIDIASKVQGISYDSLMRVNALGPIQKNKDGLGDETGLFDFGNFTVSGIIGRGLAFGNAQDASLNTNLNLQINGYLSDSLEILAAITDDNIPFQPDGSTQQLNEFDQVYMQFKKRNWQLQLGDIDMRKNDGYFFKFYKRLQGFNYDTKYKIGGQSQGYTAFGASVAKGKFFRNIINPIEGNQGPYRLSGANNELYFVVMANTERIYIDGVLRSRGEDKDYVIDYNTAEITFTSNHQITKDSRIQVEFEYADKNYLNVNIIASQNFKINEKLIVDANYFSNTDIKNAPLNQTLNQAEKLFLKSVGNEIENAFYPSEIRDSFSVNKILYEKIFINAQNGIDSFYKYSNDPDLAKYRLHFVQTGTNQGNYMEDYNGANGKVFKYVTPIDGVKQGNYEPAIFLIAPKKQELISTRIQYNFSKKFQSISEVGFSKYHLNNFAAIPANTNLGIIQDFSFTNALQASNATKLYAAVHYEYLQKNFKPIERLRNIEFSRDWGLSNLLPTAHEHLLRANVDIEFAKHGVIKYEATQYIREQQYTGHQQKIIWKQNIQKLSFDHNLTYTSYDSDSLQGKYFRPSLKFQYPISALKLNAGFNYSVEDNRIYQKKSKMMQAQAFSFQIFNFYLQTFQTNKQSFSVDYFIREDKYPLLSKLVQGDRSHNVNIKTDFKSKSANDKAYFNLTWRHLQVVQAQLSNQESGNSFLGRVGYSLQKWRNLLQADAYYEAGTGQEQKRDITFLQVPSGKGNYNWIDNNADGVQQLNEFVASNYDDQKNYIQIFLPTNVYVKANFINFRYSLRIDPSAMVRKPGQVGAKNFWKKFSYVSTLELQKKELSNSGFNFNPFAIAIADTLLISMQQFFSQSIAFNRAVNKWSSDFSFLTNKNKTLLSYGYETHSRQEFTLRLRNNLSKKINSLLFIKQYKNDLNSSNNLFENRNYEIVGFMAEPSVSYIKGTGFRLTTLYRFETKKNVKGAEVATINSIKIESKFSSLQNNSVQAAFSYSSIVFPTTISAHSTISYTMLDGLLPGNNFLWNVTIVKRIFKNLELQMQYDGRKPGHANIIHTGRAGVNALF